MVVVVVLVDGCSAMVALESMVVRAVRPGCSAMVVPVVRASPVAMVALVASVVGGWERAASVEPAAHWGAMAAMEGLRRGGYSVPVVPEGLAVSGLQVRRASRVL